ncbi:MAG: hypothetical protein KA361_00105 [Chromatiaceae bacterium]|nr:hypothetical protein [Chromatiaceae bacterium]MBP6260810.1 hypothetical protein [Chromatiaceae bacterium]MBP8023796.1 hypothetical protein [Chromatiaceae bacterium]MBP9602480.1 hypothetical protein [Chromatiaceae bacterium]
MQLIVLGMHRSGTSAVTRLINLMGGYFGPEGISVGANIENPKGFWERRDVLDLDIDLLAAAQADWFRVGHFSLDAIPATALSHFHDKAREILLDLDAHRPWVLKEPRMCLLFPLWRELLEAPICIYVHRQPIQIAQSLQTRNGFPLEFGLALWERYTLDALRGAAGLPVILVKHEEIMRNPVAETQKLLEKLQSSGVSGLRLPSDKEILGFIDPALHRQTGGIDLENSYINVRQRALAETLPTDIKSLFAKADELRISAGGLANLLAYEQRLELQRNLENQTRRPDASDADRQAPDMAARTAPNPGAVPKDFEALDRLAHSEVVRFALVQQLAESRARYAASTQDLEKMRAGNQTLATSGKLLQNQILNLNKRISQYQADTLAMKEKMSAQRANALTLQQRINQSRANALALGKRLDQYRANAQALGKCLNRSRANAQALGKRLNQSRANVLALEQRLRQYRGAGGRLEQDLQRIRASARWRLGHGLVRVMEVLMLRGKPRLVIDDMAATLAAIRRWEPVKTHPPRSGTPAASREVAQLRKWLARLDRDFRALMQSQRWRLGGILTLPLAIAKGGGEARLAADALRETFLGYHAWVPSGDTPRDLRQLDTWLLQIERDLDALLASRRWRLGHALVGRLEHLLGRGRPRLAVEEMREILNLARRWREGPGHPTPPARAVADPRPGT